MTTQPYTGKVVLVTGAAVGIGNEICRAFASGGAQVALNDIDGALAARVAGEINAEIGAERVYGWGGDIADVSGIRRMVAEIVEKFGRLDVAVCNAGITLGGRFLDYEPEQFDQLMAVNLRGTYFTAQAAARVMVEKATGGRIILMSSVTGIQAFRGLGTYGISKAGIRMMARSLALELGMNGITVNAIAPGATITERTLQEAPNYEALWSAVSPVNRVASVSDIAAAVLFFASDGTRHVTGQTMVVDGGWSTVSPLPSEY